MSKQTDHELGYAEGVYRTTGCMAGGWGYNAEYLAGLEKALADTLDRVREAKKLAEIKMTLKDKEI